MKPLPQNKRAMCFDALCKDLTDGGKRLEALREITKHTREAGLPNKLPASYQ